MKTNIDMTKWNKEKVDRWNRSSVTSNNKPATPLNKAYERFADMIIENLGKIKGDWKKPWVTAGFLSIPRSLSGSPYRGINALLLMMLSEMEGYKLPVFLTANRVHSLNYDTSKCTPCRAKDANGQELPFVHIKKGERSFPVIFALPRYYNNDGESINEEEYKALTPQEQASYDLRIVRKVYNVFNVDQTNISEARPELYQSLIDKHQLNGETRSVEDLFSFPLVDRMIAENRWICPIKPTYGDSVYFSISKNEIVIPEKSQFQDGESFYTTLFHEMAHSTGAEGQLDRIKPATFGSAEYAREELVAELSAAFVASANGMEKHIKDDSIPYINSWLSSLKENPQYIKTLCSDIQSASRMILKKMEEMRVLIEDRKSEDVISREEDGGAMDLESTKRISGSDVDGDGEIEGNEVMEEPQESLKKRQPGILHRGR